MEQFFERYASDKSRLFEVYGPSLFVESVDEMKLNINLPFIRLCSTVCEKWIKKKNDKNRSELERIKIEMFKLM